MVEKVEDYKYSSYNTYITMLNNNQRYKLFLNEDLKEICTNNEEVVENFIEINLDSQEKIKKCIELFVKKENLKLFEIFENHDRKEKIKNEKNYKNNSRRVKYKRKSS